MSQDSTQTQPADGTRLAMALVDMMSSLTQMMDYEIDLLKRRDYAGLSGLREEKNRLMRDYELGFGKIAENPSLLETTERSLREKLRTEGERLHLASARNAEGLSAAIQATQSLMQTIIEAAKAQIKTNECYTDPRKNPMMLGVYSPQCEPVAVDRSA
jgi:flagellar biosynthesis/type III secretory pathway chaperone